MPVKTNSETLVMRYLPVVHRYGPNMLYKMENYPRYALLNGTKRLHLLLKKFYIRWSMGVNLNFLMNLNLMIDNEKSNRHAGA